MLSFSHIDEVRKIFQDLNQMFNQTLVCHGDASFVQDQKNKKGGWRKLDRMIVPLRDVKLSYHYHLLQYLFDIPENDMKQIQNACSQLSRRKGGFSHQLIKLWDRYFGEISISEVIGTIMGHQPCGKMTEYLDLIVSVFLIELEAKQNENQWMKMQKEEKELYIRERLEEKKKIIRHRNHLEKLARHWSSEDKKDSTEQDNGLISDLLEKRRIDETERRQKWIELLYHSKRIKTSFSTCRTGKSIPCIKGKNAPRSESSKIHNVESSSHVPSEPERTILLFSQSLQQNAKIQLIQASPYRIWLSVSFKRCRGFQTPTSHTEDFDLYKIKKLSSSRMYEVSVWGEDQRVIGYKRKLSDLNKYVQLNTLSSLDEFDAEFQEFVQCLLIRKWNPSDCFIYLHKLVPKHNAFHRIIAQ